MPSERIVGAFVFPDFWNRLADARRSLACLRESGITAIMTESEAYDPAAIDETHAAGLQFYAGVACFSDHASNFRLLNERPELWPILEDGSRRPQLEWYIGMTPTDSQAPAGRSGENRLDRQRVSNRWTFSRFRPLAPPLGNRTSSRPPAPPGLELRCGDAGEVRGRDRQCCLAPSLETTSAKAEWIRQNRRRAVDRLQVRGGDRLRPEGAKRPEGSTTGCGARDLCRAGRRRPRPSR